MRTRAEILGSLKAARQALQHATGSYRAVAHERVTLLEAELEAFKATHAKPEARTKTREKHVEHVRVVEESEDDPDKDPDDPEDPDDDDTDYDTDDDARAAALLPLARAVVKERNAHRAEHAAAHLNAMAGKSAPMAVHTPRKSKNATFVVRDGKLVQV